MSRVTRSKAKEMEDIERPANVENPEEAASPDEEQVNDDGGVPPIGPPANDGVQEEDQEDEVLYDDGLGEDSQNEADGGRNSNSSGDMSDESDQDETDSDETDSSSDSSFTSDDSSDEGYGNGPENENGENNEPNGPNKKEGDESGAESEGPPGSPTKSPNEKNNFSEDVKYLVEAYFTKIGKAEEDQWPEEIPELLVELELQCSKEYMGNAEINELFSDMAKKSARSVDDLVVIREEHKKEKRRQHLASAVAQKQQEQYCEEQDCKNVGQYHNESARVEMQDYEIVQNHLADVISGNIFDRAPLDETMNVSNQFGVTPYPINYDAMYNQEAMDAEHDPTQPRSPSPPSQFEELIPCPLLSPPKKMDFFMEQSLNERLAHAENARSISNEFDNRQNEPKRTSGGPAPARKFTPPSNTSTPTSSSSGKTRTIRKGEAAITWNNEGGYFNALKKRKLSKK